MANSKNIFPFFPPEAEAALNEFDANHSPRVFFRALEVCLKLNHSLDPLRKRLGALDDFLTNQRDSENVLQCACELIAKLDFSECGQEDEQITGSVDVNQQTREFASQLSEAYRDLEKCYEKCYESLRYKSFKAAAPYEEALNMIFDAETPADIICRYVDALTRERAYGIDDDLWHPSDQLIRVTRTQAQFVLNDLLYGHVVPGHLTCKKKTSDAGAIDALLDGSIVLLTLWKGAIRFLLGEHRNSDGESPVDVNADDPESMKEMFETYDGFLIWFFLNLYIVPQGLFVSVLRRWTNIQPSMRSAIGKRLARILIQLPFGKPYDSWDEFNAGRVDNYKGALPWSRARTYRDLPFIPFGWLEENDLYYVLKEAWGDTFWFDNDDSDYSRMIGAYSRKIRVIRTDYLFGMFPAQPSTLCNTWVQRFMSVPDVAWDLAIKLPFVSQEGEHESAEIEDGSYWKNNLVRYHSVYESCLADGLPELGNAFLSFFLIKRTVDCVARDIDGLRIDWARLTHAAIDALAKPGGTQLMRAAQFAHSIASEKGWTLDVLCLNTLLRWDRRDPAVAAEDVSLRALPTAREVDGARAKKYEEQFIEELGAGEWRKLGKDTRRMLCEAELRFSQCARDLGRGSFKDYGAEGVAYGKALEYELKNRLGHILRSDECRDCLKNFGKASGKATFGSYFLLLKNFSELPGTLRESVIQAGVNLQNNRETLKQLGALITERNNSSHNTFDVSSIVKLRELLFDKGLLRNFVSGLSAVEGQP